MNLEILNNYYYHYVGILSKSMDLKKIEVYKAGKILLVTKEKGRKNLKVYFCLFGDQNPIIWKKLVSITKQAGIKHKLHPNMIRQLNFNQSQLLLDFWNTLNKGGTNA